MSKWEQTVDPQSIVVKVLVGISTPLHIGGHGNTL